jgi:hypothetical protein
MVCEYYNWPKLVQVLLKSMSGQNLLSKQFGSLFFRREIRGLGERPFKRSLLIVTI